MASETVCNPEKLNCADMQAGPGVPLLPTSIVLISLSPAQRFSVTYSFKQIKGRRGEALAASI